MNRKAPKSKVSTAKFLYDFVNPTSSNLNLTLERMKLWKYIMMSVLQEEYWKFQRLSESQFLLKEYCNGKISEVIDGTSITQTINKARFNINRDESPETYAEIEAIVKELVEAVQFTTSLKITQETRNTDVIGGPAGCLPPHEAQQIKIKQKQKGQHWQ